MNRREKILALAVGAALTLFVLYLAVDKLFISQVISLRKQQDDLRGKIESGSQDKQTYTETAARLPGLFDRTFGSDENLASERVRARLDSLLKASGFQTDIALTPQGSAKVRTSSGDIAGNEVTWQVVTKGKLEQLINFLYLLDAEPYLHRIESLSLSPDQRTGVTEMQLRFMSFVPASWQGEELPTGTAAQESAPGLLEAPGRKVYEVIALRDVFRPYLEYRPPPPPPPPPPSPPPQPSPPPPAVQQKIVALATWAGQQEVHVRDLANGRTEVLKPGQTLAEGQIVMIDYRRLPMPGKPEVLSTSRVILRKGDAYWAIELGQETASSRQLPNDQLPQQLKTN